MGKDGERERESSGLAGGFLRPWWENKERRMDWEEVLAMDIHGPF